MEWSNVVEAVVSDLLAQVIVGISALTILGLGAVLGTLLFGRGYKRRIAALEAQAQQPSINQVINFNAGANTHDNESQLRHAIEAKTSQNLTKTIRSLPQIPLSDGHTYARLPDGTNIVSMADGSFRLAVPIVLNVAFKGELRGDLKASISLERAPKDDDA